ncbi:MAG: DUF5916 domain-containing protein, partial [Gemmatimonadota bacterium]
MLPSLPLLRATLLVLLLAPATAQAAQESTPGNDSGVDRAAPAASADPGGSEGVLTAEPLAGEIRLDGRLDEPAWSAAAAVSDFRQQEPDEGQPATQATEVRILFAPDRLYIGASLRDPDPGRILARVLERDALVEGVFGGVTSDDDAFFVVLDTYDDDRNGFLFGTNANGAEADALLRAEGELNESWDGVWDVAAAVGAEGWSAEIEVPFWTLRFDPESAQRWGVNFQRVLKRRNEIALWRSWTRDNGGLLKVSQAGSLLGLADLDQGRNLQVKPFALAEGRRESLPDGAGGFDAESDGSLDAGLDVKYGMTSNLTLDGTVNTDFAQVEADVRQINLTRFNLFFPEKREFFLEGAGIFTFGVPGFGGPPPLLVFFSRRIGLRSGAEVPILAGAKLTGKEGAASLGFLDVVTGDEDAVGAPPENFAVARLTRDVGARSTVGAILTHETAEGLRPSWAGGVDTHVQVSPKLAFDGFVSATDAPGAEGGNGAYRAALDFTADAWGWLVEQMAIGPGYEPSMGFVLRDDIQRQFATFRVSPRPAFAGLRRIDVRANATIVSSAGWDVRDRGYRVSVTPQLDSGDLLELAGTHNFVRLADPFELREDVVFPAADYEGDDLDVTLRTSRNRPVSGDLFAGTNDFFSGRLRYYGGRLIGVVNRNLSFEGFWQHNAIDTPDGDLSTDLGTLRVNYAFSTRLFTNALLQYDSETDEVEANVRVNFIHSPGSDLFIVL